MYFRILCTYFICGCVCNTMEVLFRQRSEDLGIKHKNVGTLEKWKPEETLKSA